MNLWFVVKWEKDKMRPQAALSVHMRYDDARDAAHVAIQEQATNEVISICGPVHHVVVPADELLPYGAIVLPPTRNRG